MTRNIQSFYAVGVTGTGPEADEGVFCHGPLWGGGFRRDGSQTGITFDHGHGGLAVGFSNNEFSFNGFMQAAVKQGMVALAGDNSGPNHWASDAAMAAKDAHYNYMTNPAAFSSLVLRAILKAEGWSMGGLTILEWAWRNIAKLDRIVCWAPATRIRYFHDKNPAGYGAEVEAEYGPDWSTLIPAHEPINHAAEFGDLLDQHDVHVRIYHGDQDTTVPIDHSREYVAAVGSPRCKLYELPGRDHVNLFGAVDKDDVCDFLWGKVPA